MIAVSKVWRRSFGTRRLTPPPRCGASVRSCRLGYPVGLGCVRNVLQRKADQLPHPAAIERLFNRSSDHLGEMITCTVFFNLNSPIAFNPSSWLVASILPQLRGSRQS